ncbi:MAG: carbamoyl-phosphate synthase large subunit [Acidobacteria bacterium]|nr:carbamoyl-phosphate synthase large subunit [Acidobacteriota bacterium]
MPRRTDIHKILIIGSGPIVIGQACEFDYSGTQACKALRSEGYQVVLVNSNPATIMTDPELADRTYIEPMEVPYIEAIIEQERPDALLSTVGGQTALNLSVQLAEKGILEKYGVELIGAGLRAIQMAEDRLMFKDAMARIGLDTPRSSLVNNQEDGLEFAGRIGYPVILRPSFTLGGTGGGLAYNREEFSEILSRGLDLSPVHEVLVEESVLGWKEFELEVMRDLADNVIIICSIENFDPMGVHTGDSITVAPAQTLTDKEYQVMRDAAIAIIREVGVETGGSNIQFAVQPETGRLLVIEMNPRVSRSSALASKATGFPIAKIASKLAVGYRLDEIPNDITRKTPSCFEPTLDYVVVKIPKWQFEKFPGADASLGPQMKSIGEVMAIGRTFKEALMKGLRSLETGKSLSAQMVDERLITQRLVTPSPERLDYIRHVLRQGWSVKQVADMTAIDPWFLQQIQQVEAIRKNLGEKKPESLSRDELWAAKRAGISDRRLADLWHVSSEQVHEMRQKLGVLPVFKRVDTCAAEFESYTPYMYSCYEQEDEAEPTDRKKILILGSGPNRIGQGIEFDYCCCHASFALREDGYETILVNCNPETVSTDYDTSDRLYFEPLTFEDVMAVVREEKPDGVIVQFGGQTPLNLALPLKRAGVPIIGTSPESIDLAEDRRRFGELLTSLGIPQPENGSATTLAEAREIVARIGYPVLVRPSYVLGGRAMVIAYDEATLDEYVREAREYSEPGRPILIDRFLEAATEVDVDALSDGKQVLIAGIMEHIEEAGIHSGDSSCVLPSFSLGPEQLRTVSDYTVRLALALEVVGLMNVQYAVQNGKVYVLEVNPRASRTVPYVSKATGVPLAKLASRLMTGRALREFSIPADQELVGKGAMAGELANQFLGVLPVKQFCVKSPVFPFSKYPGVDPILGPEMKSTGEVMGIGEQFGEAFAKSQLSAGTRLPLQGRAFLSVQDKDKTKAIAVARKLAELDFEIVATRGTAQYLTEAGIPVRTVYKLLEGRPNVVDLIKGGEMQLLINTPMGATSFFDEKAIRRAAVQHRVPCITTIAGGLAAVEGIAALKQRTVRVLALQDMHAMTVERESLA